MSNTIQFFGVFSLIVALSVLKTEAFPRKFVTGQTYAIGSEYVNKGERLGMGTVVEKNIVKRQVVPGSTGPGQYGGTWNSKDGKTQVKAGVDFNSAPQLGWHADAKHQIYKNPSGKVTVDAFGGANQPFNQVGKSRPDVHGGVRVNFR